MGVTVIMGRIRQTLLALGLVVLTSCSVPTQTGNDAVEDAITTIRSLDRPGRDILATIYDGNKYIQCRRETDLALHCEAGGALLQPSLERVLTPERIGRLAAAGWMPDPSFGNFVQVFPAESSAKDVADKIRWALAQGYEADIKNLAVRTDSIPHETCPPRHGPSQNLAGMIDDSPTMAAYAIHACAYRPADDQPKKKLGPGSTAADLIDLYGPRVTTELHRLRINTQRRVYVIFGSGIGYIQCEPDKEPPAFYCEAQSADSWAPLAAILTPEHIARLHAAGFADPGYAPNYSRTYPFDKITDSALASEILTLLHDIYNYHGATKLEVKTEGG